MDEQFLHYIWKFQKFTNEELQLVDGSSLHIFHQGNHNHDSGPDFEEGRVKINDIEWAGHIEIHIKSSDWNKHGHQHDKAYNNVVLHVVWEDDEEILVNNSPIPTLELKGRIDLTLLSKYQSHLDAKEDVLCTTQLSKVNQITISSMLDRVMSERLEQKASEILSLLKETKNDWEEAFYCTLARNFGFSVNKDAFVKLATSLPFKLLKKYTHQPKSIEALLFGQSGFLESAIDEYQVELQKEFKFLQSKHQLKDPINKSEWKFGRMRPANFPSVRLSQFASLISQNPHLFTHLLEVKNVKEFIQTIHCDLSDYWIAHYDFGKVKKKKGMKIGDTTFHNIIINTLVPILAAYSKYSGNQHYMDRALELLELVPSENNRITKKWVSIGQNPKNALDTQAMIQLYKNYCQPQQCLSCNIGVALLSK
ncbi:MAG: DUF2851 family protein [Ekhidna sp.]